MPKPPSLVALPPMPIRQCRALMSAAGNATKRQAPIDPRNYGVKNFTALFTGMGLFEILKGENGQSYVADKRNKDRAPRPGG